MVVKLPKHLKKLLDTPAKRKRAEKIMAQARQQELLANKKLRKLLRKKVNKK